MDAFSLKEEQEKSPISLRSTVSSTLLSVWYGTDCM